MSRPSSPAHIFGFTDPFARATASGFNPSHRSSLADPEMADNNKSTPTGNGKKRKPQSTPDHDQVQKSATEIISHQVWEQIKQITRDMKKTSADRPHLCTADFVIKQAATIEAVIKNGIESLSAITTQTRDHLRTQHDLIDILKSDNDRLREENDGLKKTSNHDLTMSYAAAASRSATTTTTQPTRRPKTRHTTIVKAAGKDPKEVEKLVKDSLKEVQSSLRASVRNTGAAVIVTCDDQNRLDEAKHYMKGQGLELNDRSLLRPQIRIEGLDNFDNEELITEINEANDDVLGICGSKVVQRTVNRRDKNKIDVVIATTGESQRLILQKGSVLIGYQYHRVVEHLRVRQCVRCLGIGHKKDQCKACERCLVVGCKDKKCRPRKICFRCGGDHMRKECPADQPAKCSVCFHHSRIISGKSTRDNCDHPMLGRECEIRKIEEEAMRRKTDYNA